MINDRLRTRSASEDRSEAIGFELSLESSETKRGLKYFQNIFETDRADIQFSKIFSKPKNMTRRAKFQEMLKGKDTKLECYGSLGYINGSQIT